MSRRHHAEEEGQGVVILGLGVLILMGFLALGVDGGYAYLQRRLIQNAADAGAMAGTHALALGQGGAQAIALATEYARDRNGADEVEVIVDEVARSVTVVARKRFSTFFAVVIGHTSMGVAAQAGARFAPVRELPEGVYPIAVHEESFHDEGPTTSTRRWAGQLRLAGLERLRECPVPL